MTEFKLKWRATPTREAQIQRVYTDALWQGEIPYRELPLCVREADFGPYFVRGAHCWDLGYLAAAPDQTTVIEIIEQQILQAHTAYLAFCGQVTTAALAVLHKGPDAIQVREEGYYAGQADWGKALISKYPDSVFRFEPRQHLNWDARVDSVFRAVANATTPKVSIYSKGLDLPGLFEVRPQITAFLKEVKCREDEVKARLYAEKVAQDAENKAKREARDKRDAETKERNVEALNELMLKILVGRPADLARYHRGFIPIAEQRDLIRGHVWGDRDAGWSRYRKIKAADIPCSEECYGTSEVLDFQVTNLDDDIDRGLTTTQFERLVEIETVFGEQSEYPGAVEVKVHVGTCKECDASIERFSAHVSIYVHGVHLTREYALWLCEDDDE